MRKFFRTTVPHGVSRFMSKTLVFKTPSIIEHLLVNVIEDADGNKCGSISNDIQLLLNQNRLNHLGPDNISQYLDQLSVNLSKPFSALTQLRKKMTDEQLMHFMKSRYVQTPSEMKAWISYLNNQYDKVLDDVEKEVMRQAVEYAEAQKAKEEEQLNKDSTETVI